MPRNQPKRRRSNRWPAFGAAYAFFQHGDHVECLLKRLSAEGADLTCGASGDVPDDIQMWIPGEGIRAPARVVWRNREAFGIQFTDADTVQRLLERSRSTGGGPARLDRIVEIYKRGEAARRMNATSSTADMMAAGTVAGGAVMRPSPSVEAAETMARKPPAAPGPSGGPVREAAADIHYDIDDIVASLRSVMVSYREIKGGSCREVQVLERVLGDLSLIGRPRKADADEASWYGRRVPTATAG